MIPSPGCTEVPAPFVSAAATRAHWYALYTRSNYEKQVAAELTNRGIENYLPTVQQVHSWKDRRKLVDVPIFRSYVFTRFADIANQRLRVLQTNGVVRILGNTTGGGIEAIPAIEIQSIQKLVDSAKPFVSFPLLRKGSRVRVKRGVLAGVEGLFVRFKGRTRLVLTVEILAQSIAVEIDPMDIEMCS